MAPFSRLTRMVLPAFLASTLLLGGNSSARAGLTTDLLAYYHLDGNGIDSSGNGYNLSLVGNPAFGPGLYGQALALNGDSSQYATRPGDDAAFNFGSSNFTIQVWVNFNAFGNSEQTLIEKFTGGGGPGWTLTTPSDGSGQFIEFAATTTNSSLDEVNTAQVSITPGTWNQIVVERNGNTVSIYLDNALLVSDSFTGSIIGSSNPLLIGGRYNSGGSRGAAVNGSLDEIAIWNRALSTSEVSSLWNNGEGQLMGTSVPEPSSFALAVTAATLIGLYTGARHR
jgi:Concanavalin A-like lectin/glucanases superfamily